MTEAALRDVFQRQLDAMRRGDTSSLSRLLHESFTLTHMTGYRQAGSEWLSEIRNGLFVYHGIEIRSLEVDNARAWLLARLLTDATIYGTRATWRLQLRQDYRLYGADLLAISSVASTW